MRMKTWRGPARASPPLRRSSLKQSQSFRGGPQLIVAPKSFFANGPIRPLTQPAEMQVDSGSIECPSKIRGRALRPAGGQILAFTLSHDVLGPMFALRERGQIDFARGDGRRFPVQHEQLFLSNQHSLGVEFAMYD